MEAYIHVGLSGKAKDIFYGIIIIGCWNIWKARNNSKFQKREWKTLSGKLRLWVFFGLRIGPNWLLCLGPIGVNLISCSLVFVVFAAPFCGLGGF